MKTMAYRIGAAALVLSFAASGAWAQSTAGGNVGSMMGSAGTAGMTVKGSGPAPAPSAASSAQGGGPSAGNYGYGPWMMGGGGYSGYAPGPWMMGGGWMGPQMMGWGGGYGACGGAFGPARQANLDLTVAEVKIGLERMLALGGNPHIKLGPVVEKNPDTIAADIVTTDNGGLVQRLEINRETGFVQPAEQ